MDLHNALRKYNMGKSTKLSYQSIAQSLRNIKTGKPLTKQALFLLTDHGGKKGLNAYKDQLKEVLPEELFNMIDFPKHVMSKRTEKVKEEDFDMVLFTDEEKLRISNVEYISKVLYKKSMANVPVTKYMHDKWMKQVADEEERIRKCMEENGTIVLNSSQTILEETQNDSSEEVAL